MKHFFTLLLATLLLASSAGAQTPDPVQQQRALPFANLDKSQIPTGRLAEYALPLAPLTAFDGVLRDSGRADMDGFRYLYTMLLSGRLAGTEALPTLAVLNQRVRAAAPTGPAGPIPVAVQYVRYARLRPDAETAGLVTLQNNQLFDVAGRSQSPYQTAVAFMAAPERTYSATNTVSLVLPRTLYLASGAPGNAPSVVLDFGDGRGYRPVAWDQPLNTTYATAGTKRVKVKLTYTFRVESDDQIGSPPTFADTRESWFDLTVFAVAAAARYAEAAGFKQVFAPTATPVNVLGAVYYPPNANFTDHLGATVNVRFGLGHTRIVKPFIVVEGYSTSRIAPHLVGEGNKDNVVQDFLDKTDDDFTAPFGLNHQLEQAGYDLIYIDFNEGTDYIQRNAALFEQVLRWVNDEKQRAGSVETNVVMGESMGGLVARYGLARLVRNGYDPQTRKLILHDSPQRGAYNPMGVQALTLQTDFGLLPNIRTRDLSDKLNEALNILDAPATKQLALLSVTGIDDEYDTNTFIEGAYKDMVDFGSAGPPSTFPVLVATSDGSQCGRPQSTAPHQELTRNTGAYLLNVFVVNVGFKSDVVVNALPAYGTQDRLAHFRVYFTISILWAHLDITVINRNYTSPANTLPYETLPGGYVNPADQQSLAGGIFRPFFWNITFLYNGPICFVPSFSALDVQTITPATAAVSYLYGAPPQTSAVPRVASFIAMEAGSGNTYNQSHLRFTARNSEWIFNEMQGIGNAALNCRAECSPYPPVPIMGSDIICTNGSTQLTIAPPFGNVTNWTASPAGLVTFTTPTVGATSVTLVPASNLSGVVAVTAYLSNGCFSTTTTQQIGVGPPAAELVGPTTVACGDPQESYRIAPFFHAQTYSNLTVTGPASLKSLGYEQSGEFALVFRGPGLVHVTLDVHGDCGDQQAELEVTVSNCGPKTAAVLYPNPAKETVDVHVENADAAHPVTVRLFDGYGRPRAEQISTGAATVRLKTDQLPAGLYFVHILRGKAVLSRQQLRIEK